MTTFWWFSGIFAMCLATFGHADPSRATLLVAFAALNIVARGGRS